MIRFIADVHLGKLARSLRLLGFDTQYRNDQSRQELIHTAVNEERHLLSKDARHALNPYLKSFIVKGEDAENQLLQVLEHYQLRNSLRPFTRCIICNGLLEEVPKETVSTLLEEKTLRHFHRFWQCNDCKRVYWKGSHYERMIRYLEKLDIAVG